MKKPKRRHPRRSASTGPQLTSPLPLGSPSPGNDDGGEDPGLETHHHHFLSGEGRALADRLREDFGHDWPEELVVQFGVRLVDQVLDELTQKYGAQLQELDSAGRDLQDYATPPKRKVRSPAGFITWHVKKRAASRDKYGYPDLRLVDDTDALSSQGGAS